MSAPPPPAPPPIRPVPRPSRSAPSRTSRDDEEPDDLSGLAITREGGVLVGRFRLVVRAGSEGALKLNLVRRLRQIATTIEEGD